MKKALLAFALSALFSCEQQNLNKENLSTDCIEKINPDVACTLQYDPVCGCNLKTYGNACAAGAAGIRVLYNGECKK